MGAVPVNRGERGWFVRFNHQGKRWSQKAGSAKDAEQIAAAFNRQQAQATQAKRPAGPKPFGGIAQAWLDEVWGGVADTTRESRRYIVATLLVPRLKNVDIRNLNDRAVRRLAESLAGDGYAQESVLTFGRAFATILRWALREKMIAEAPCRAPFTIFKKIAEARCPPPKHDAPAWRTEEVEELLHAAVAYGQHFGDCALFAYHTGCRVGELVALEWDDVDLHNRRVIFRQSRSRHQLKGTKTGKIRENVLTIECIEMLKRRQKIRTTHKNVFLNFYGRPWQARDISQVWKTVRTQTNARPFQWHAWRHTWASHALRATGNPGWCAKQIGDTEAIFWTRYYHYIHRNEPTPDFLTSGPFAKPQPTPDAPPASRARPLKVVR